MKLTGKRADTFLAKPDTAVRAVLIYGPDSGLVKERADHMVKLVVSDPSDPFRVAELNGVKIKDSPALLLDEMLAVSLIGGKRVVRVRDASDHLTVTLQSFLADPLGDSVVILEGAEFTPRSTLRKFCETCDIAAAISCYNDEGRGLEITISQMIRDNGYSANQEIIQLLADNLGSDRLLTRSEMNKLFLYMGEDKRINFADVAACIGDSSALDVEELVLAIADGHQKNSQRILIRLLSEGMAIIAILRSMQRHFQRLHLAKAAMEHGKTLDAAINSLKPPPHFRTFNRMKSQLGHWSIDKLAQALDSIVQAEVDCKTTGMPSREICGRLTMRLAGFVRKSQSGR